MAISTAETTSPEAAALKPSDDSLTSFVMIMGRLERLNGELISNVCARHDISPSEIRVLAMLREANTSIRPATMSQWVLQTAGGLSATLRRLEESGRIERAADPDDGRGKRISLTPRGEAFHDLVLGEINERYRYVMGHINLEAARAHILDLVGAFERFGNHPPSAEWANQPTKTAT